MKKLLAAAFITIAFTTACNEGAKTETPATVTVTDTVKPATVTDRAKEISDSTKRLDRKLADPKSNYSPDSLT